MFFRAQRFLQDGGNPWVLITSALANLLYQAPAAWTLPLLKHDEMNILSFYEFLILLLPLPVFYYFFSWCFPTFIGSFQLGVEHWRAPAGRLIWSFQRYVDWEQNGCCCCMFFIHCPKQKKEVVLGFCVVVPHTTTRGNETIWMNQAAERTAATPLTHQEPLVDLELLVMNECPGPKCLQSSKAAPTMPTSRGKHFKHRVSWDK